MRQGQDAATVGGPGFDRERERERPGGESAAVRVRVRVGQRGCACILYESNCIGRTRLMWWSGVEGRQRLQYWLLMVGMGNNGLLL